MALAEFHYFSQALAKQTAVNVIVPDTPGPWPVMFLLHGLSDDHTIWQRRTRIESYMEGTNLMVVMPDGGRGFYCDAVQGYAYATAIGVELPELIRQWFRTTDQWAISGLSMGGYGAVRTALDHPDLFVSAVSLSGALGFAHGDVMYRSDVAEEFTRIHGPAPDGGPNDLHALVAKLPADRRPALRIDCGTEDFLIEDNRAYRRHLGTLGIPHEYVENSGAHTWDYWDTHIRPALAFHRRNLGLDV